MSSGGPSSSSAGEEWVDQADPADRDALDAAILSFHTLLAQQSMAESFQHGHGVIPYNSPVHALEVIRLMWTDFQEQEAGRLENDGRRSEEGVLTQLGGLNEIQKRLEVILPIGRPLSNPGLRAICSSFNDVYARFYRTYEVPSPCRLLISRGPFRPVSGKSVLARSFLTQEGELDASALIQFVPDSDTKS
jgi:hypothetical protein